MAAPLGLKPGLSVHGSCKASFRGLTSAFQKLTFLPAANRRQKLCVEASRTCELTGKKANNGYVVTFSHKRNKKLQGANLQYKRLFWAEEKRWVRLRISTKAMKTVEKRGLQVMAKEAGIDLYSLPYVDARPERQEWLAQQPKYPPMAKDHVGKSRRMKNPEKLAASSKKPLVARYIVGNRVILTRDPTHVSEYAT